MVQSTMLQFAVRREPVLAVLQATRGQVHESVIASNSPDGPALCRALAQEAAAPLPEG